VLAIKKEPSGKGGSFMYHKKFPGIGEAFNRCNLHFRHQRCPMSLETEKEPAKAPEERHLMGLSLINYDACDV